jgi:arylsulfatase A-like enzyme
MAARLQLSAPEVTDLAGESELTRKLYAIDHPETGPFGRQCLLARRMAERGVRFVQIYCGAENTTAKKIRPNWDSHEDIVRDHGYWGEVLDTGASALLIDLKARGMLEDTLVICTSEFGRQPAAQGANKGRDHNAGAFTSWMAGGGVKAGTGYGSTDELGFEAVDKAIHSWELHATALHLLGIDHEKLSWYHNGLEQRLTGFEGKGVVRELLG